MEKNIFLFFLNEHVRNFSLVYVAPQTSSDYVLPFCSRSCFPSIAEDDVAEAAGAAEATAAAAKPKAKSKKKDDSMALLAEGLAAVKVKK